MFIHINNRNICFHGCNVKTFSPTNIQSLQFLFLEINYKNCSKHFKNNDNIEFFDNKYDALNEYDGLIIVTEWNEFKSPDFNEISKRMNNKIIFDGRNQFDKNILSNIGFEYYQI